MNEIEPAARLFLRDLAGREDGARVIDPGSILGQIAGPLVDAGLIAVGGRTFFGVRVRLTEAGMRAAKGLDGRRPAG